MVRTGRKATAENTWRRVGNVKEKTINTIWAKIYISGPVEEAKQIIRQECLREGLCVTIEPTLFIYKGGEEFGCVVGLINYPRFPSTSESIWDRAVDLAMKLLEGTYQESVLIMSPDKTQWFTKREQ
jgi:hypothetical protein